MPTIDPYVLLVSFVRQVTENYPHLLSAHDAKELTRAFVELDLLAGTSHRDRPHPALEHKNILRVADHISAALDGKPWRRTKIKLGEMLFTREEVEGLLAKASRYISLDDSDGGIRIIDSETGETAEVLSVEPPERGASFDGKARDSDILKELLSGVEFFGDGTAGKAAVHLTPADQRFKAGGTEQPQKVRHNDTALTNERWGTW